MTNGLVPALSVVLSLTVGLVAAVVPGSGVDWLSNQIRDTYLPFALGTAALSGFFWLAARYARRSNPDAAALGRIQSGLQEQGHVFTDPSAIEQVQGYDLANRVPEVRASWLLLPVLVAPLPLGFWLTSASSRSWLIAPSSVAILVLAAYVVLHIQVLRFAPRGDVELWPLWASRVHHPFRLGNTHVVVAETCGSPVFRSTGPWVSAGLHTRISAQFTSEERFVRATLVERALERELGAGLRAVVLVNPTMALLVAKEGARPGVTRAETWAIACVWAGELFDQHSGAGDAMSEDKVLSSELFARAPVESIAMDLTSARGNARTQEALSRLLAAATPASAGVYR